MVVCLFCGQSQKARLAKAGLHCKVCPLGGALVILRFNSIEEASYALKNFSNVFDQWFVSISWWEKTKFEREIPVWVTLEDVPLHFWGLDLFKAIGDSWGSFLEVDTDTACHNRFDIARVLIEVKSKACIPPKISVFDGEYSYKIHITTENTVNVYALTATALGTEPSTNDRVVGATENPKQQSVDDSMCQFAPEHMGDFPRNTQSHYYPLLKNDVLGEAQPTKCCEQNTPAEDNRHALVICEEKPTKPQRPSEQPIVIGGEYAIGPRDLDSDGISAGMEGQFYIDPS